MAIVDTETCTKDEVFAVLGIRLASANVFLD